MNDSSFSASLSSQQLSFDASDSTLSPFDSGVINDTLSSDKLRSLAFVDAALGSVDILMEGLENTQVVLLNSETDGIAQITETLSDYENLDAIHIFSHGSDGLLQLGDTIVSNSSVEGYGDSLQQWAAALSSEADLMIYSCNLGAGIAGNTLINRISTLTGADVAASDDVTGVNGDWQLEVAVGEIESESVLSVSAQERYDSDLVLLTNGDFEQGLTGWNFFSADGVITTDSVSGSAAVEVTGRSRGFKQELSASEGQVYTLTGSSKSNSSGRASVGMTFYDQNFNRLTDRTRRITNADWREFMLEKTAPTGTQFVRVWTYKSNEDGSLFIDNLALDGGTTEPPTPPTSGDELLSNAGFESGLSGWRGFTGTERSSGADAFAGGKSLALAAAGSGVRQTVNAAAGETYKISGYGKTTSSGYVGFGFNFFDANNNKLPGGAGSRVRGTDWQSYENQAVAPAGTKTIRLWAIKSKADGEAFLDQMSLTASGSTPPPPSDTSAPTAALLNAANVNSAANSYDFDVSYEDATAVDIDSLDNNDVSVTGPGGFSQSATLVSVNNSADGSPRTATYRIVPPGGDWNVDDNGTYNISLNNGQVGDTLGNVSAGKSLGSFEVNVAGSVSSGLIGLEDSTINVSESDATAVVTVLRSGGSDGVLTVDYSTVSGSATANVDYVPTSGTLTFADGETQRSVAIALLNDNNPEEQETFGFAIDNVSDGGSLGAPRTAQVTIADDDGFTYNGNQYVLTSGLTTWQQAQSEASSLGGNLVSINTAAEEAWLRQTFGESEGFWTGLNDAATEGSFEWVSGDPVGYTNWAPGEPNNGGAGGQDYGWINYGPTQQWDDDSGDAVRRGIVEIGGFNGPSGGQGNGLKGEYYNNSDFTDLAVTRTDEVVDFDWGLGSPASNVAADTFSVRWAGRVEPLYSETYTFQTTTDDGVRLWVNDQLIIDRFVTQPPTASFGTITLQAGQQYNIRMEYFENEGGASAELAWSSASQPLQIVPRSQLYSDPVDSRNLTSQTVLSNLNFPTSIDWFTDGSNRMLVAEQGGVVKLSENGSLRSTPFIDISSQVNGVRDRGLLDIAVHPDFANNPYVYLLFTYDPPEVFNNTGGAGPDGQNNRAARLVRVTADASNNYRTAVADSEVILLGKNSTWENFNGFVNSTTNLSEPAAGILPDGTNLQDFLNADSESHTIGSVEFGPDGALYVSNGDGASYNRVDRRASRVQDIDNLSGKVLRIDPITGKGLSNNPFFNGDADANRSKVYQLGLRNPFRMTVDPNNGQVYVGDVGWTTWEEINAAGPGANFGWPYYEGASGTSAVTRDYEDLPEAQAFYNSGRSVTPSLYGLNHADTGINAIVMGDIYTGDAYPDRYKGDLFFGDLGQGIIRNISFDNAGNISAIDTFDIEDPYVVQMAEGPDDQLYYVNQLNGTVKRWVFT